jgi:5-methylcytosine-specific restriction enzyme subunit McrC
MPRTIHLTERKPHRVRLALADVVFFQKSHRNHIDLAPTGRRGVFRLTPRGCAGVIVAPTHRLIIHPKIPLQNLFLLLDPDDPVSAAPDEAAPAPNLDILDFLAGWLARLLTERGAAGLRRGYRECAEEGPFLHGRIDVAAQMRESVVRKDRLHSVRDDFTADVPCNQAPKATAERLLASSLLGVRVREMLLQALRGFEEVTPAPLTPDVFAAAEADRLAEGYRPLLDLCRLLADALGPSDVAGATPCPAFLLDMERVFERYITRGVAEAFAGADGWTAAAQQTHVVAPGVEMRPDVTVHCDGRPMMVMDAKWKRPASAPSPADLYQMLAYCTALNVGRAVLVYPGRRDSVRAFPLNHAPVCVEIRSLRVAGDRAQCVRSLKRLGQALKMPQGRE